MPSIESIRSFWDSNPLCAEGIPHEIGSPAYFSYFNRLRDRVEAPDFSRAFYGFDQFRGKKVLDVGSGNGYILSRYAEHGADVFGVDITPTGVDLCRKRFALSNLKGDFRVANAEELPFPDNTFDAVCSMGVLHHTETPEKAIQEIFRVMKPGGRLNLMLYHRDSILYRFKFPILHLLTKKSIQQLVNEVDGIGNPKGDVYSRDEMRTFVRQFENIELSVHSIQGWMLLPFVGRFIPDFLFKTFQSRWGWFLYACGTKPVER